MTELVWDSARLGTATASSGASITVGEHAQFSTNDLLGAAAAGCLMQTFVRLAEDAKASILSFAATAHCESRRPLTPPHVTVHVYVVAPWGADAQALFALLARSTSESPIAQLLADRITMTADVRVLCTLQPAVREEP